MLCLLYRPLRIQAFATVTVMTSYRVAGYRASPAVVCDWGCHRGCERLERHFVIELAARVRRLFGFARMGIALGI
jgi:hypothetical protein